LTGVLQAQHNLLVHLGEFPDARSLRLVLDSQRILSRNAATFAKSFPVWTTSCGSSTGRAPRARPPAAAARAMFRLSQLFPALGGPTSRVMPCGTRPGTVQVIGGTSGSPASPRSAARRELPVGLLLEGDDAAGGVHDH
jgi:hypothetical protein